MMRHSFAALALIPTLLACSTSGSDSKAGDGDGDENGATGDGDSGGGGGDGDGGSGSGDDLGPPTITEGGLKCSAGYTCTEGNGDVVWVMKNDGNVNGPSCQNVCERALSENCAYHACEQGRAVEHTDATSFAPLAESLGFTCRPGGCWDSVSPTEGLVLVSIDTAEDGTKSCYFPGEGTLSCDTHPGNANCFGERYASVCACTTTPLDEACTYECGPHNTERATWKTEGTSCLARINYWRKRACEEGWVECPPAGLPPMSECTACHECSNSEAVFDSENGAHASFTRCGESAQGEGGGETCADVIDSFVAERAPDENGVMRCEGHCGPILEPGCRSFSWGKAKDSGFHTLNWGACNAEMCGTYCSENAGQCFTHDTSPSLECDDPNEGNEEGPVVSVCQAP